MTNPEPDNPLRAGIRLERVAESCSIVIFGATGDLTKRKLVPALYRLSQQRLIPAQFAIIGTARQGLNDEEFRSNMRQALAEFAEAEQIDEPSWQNFAAGIYYVSGEFGDPNTYAALKAKLGQVEAERHTQGSRIFYLATAPEFFGPIVKQLGASGMAKPEKGWTRIIVEKPFGHDLESARTLNTELASVFAENQIYRIDHYLGKETVQNLLVFRFANSIFEPLWNRQYVDLVQITNAEAIGVEGRGGYYEHAGALRDMMQNHVFQIVSLVAMEPPASLSANSVHDEKFKAMQSVHPFATERIDEFAVRGQYGPGLVLVEQ